MADATNDTPQPQAESPASPGVPTRNGRYDVVTHRIVVVALSLTVLATALDITILQAMGRDSPSALTNLGATAIGALAMCLATIMRPH